MQGPWGQFAIFDRLLAKQYGKPHIWKEIMNKAFRKQKFS